MTRKAIIIDDAYALPTHGQLKGLLPALRSALNRDEEGRVWFESFVSVKGQPTSPDYFEALESDATRQALWGRRAEWPERLARALAELAAEIDERKAPLHRIETALITAGYDIRSYPALPKVDDAADADLIVIDYVLTDRPPEEFDELIRASTEYVSNVARRAEATAECRVPFVVLVSSLPGAGPERAQAFKAQAKVQGGLFRFVPKAQIDPELPRHLERLAHEEPELRAFQKFHSRFSSAVRSASGALVAAIEELELQDLATLQVGQLAIEQESLSDYLSWLAGQVITSRLLRDGESAVAAEELPEKSLALLVTHLEPTDTLPKLFCDISAVRVASSELSVKSSGARNLRFGDVFRTVASSAPKGDPAGIASARYWLVVSQSCDMMRCNTGDVLCLEGSARHYITSESALLEATIFQASEQSSLIGDSGGYAQVSWNGALRSFPYKWLSRTQRLEWVGRLHELQTLEAQNRALRHVGRVGLPIAPRHGQYFTRAQVRLIAGKSGAVLEKELLDGTVLATVRYPKKGQNCDLLVSTETARWLQQLIADMQGHERFPSGINDAVDKFRAYVASGQRPMVVRMSDSVPLDTSGPQPKAFDRISMVLDAAQFAPAKSPASERIEIVWSRASIAEGQSSVDDGVSSASAEAAESGAE